MTPTKLDLLCMGRSSIDLYAHEIGVPITDVKSFDAYVGGCPTNVAVGTRRLGVRSGLLTGIGTDQVGDFVLDFLAREGVDTASVARFPERRTSAALLTIQPPDRFPLTFYRDNCADLALTIDHVRRSPAAASRLLFVTGTGLSEEPSRTATLFAAETARAAATQVILDVDYRAGLWPSEEAFGTNVRTLAAFADVAIGTEEELRAATGLADPSEACARMLDAGPQLLVLKRGGEGARVFARGDRPTDVPPFKITVMNVLGAGDAFASGFIYGYLQGWTAADAARLGNATGAIVVTRHGCANFMPTLDEVRAFLAQQGATDLRQLGPGSLG
jgi:5-dehydro-2-deoxygluconokinase